MLASAVSGGLRLIEDKTDCSYNVQFISKKNDCERITIAVCFDIGAATRATRNDEDDSNSNGGKFTDRSTLDSISMFQIIILRERRVK